MSTQQEQEKKEVTAIVLMAKEIAKETDVPITNVLQAINLNGGFHRHVPAELVESLVREITVGIKKANETFHDEPFPGEAGDSSNGEEE